MKAREQLVTVSSPNTNENPAGVDDLTSRRGFPHSEEAMQTFIGKARTILAALESVKWVAGLDLKIILRGFLWLFGWLSELHREGKDLPAL